jgi:hypothetical protein
VHVFEFENTVTLVVYVALFAVKMWAMIDALTRPAQAFPAADKLTKPAWLWILGLTLVAHVVLNSVMLDLAGAIAAFVYLLDVRPAVASVTRRR